MGEGTESAAEAVSVGHMKIQRSYRTKASREYWSKLEKAARYESDVWESFVSTAAKLNDVVSAARILLAELEKHELATDSLNFIEAREMLAEAIENAQP